jgi:hypothetical protein
MTVHCLHPAPGCASVLFGATGRRLWFRCDPVTHHVVVSDDAGRVVRAFGGHGRGPGRFDTPLDLTVVEPQFAGEPLPRSADALWLAVADYGNRRIQVVELDGAVVGEVRGEPGTVVGGPTALRWTAPVLEVVGVEGATTQIYLSGALLAASWPEAERRRAPAALEARH